MYLVLVFLFTLLVAIFAVQNYSPVMVRFLPWQFEMSVALIVLGSASAGAVIVGLRGLFLQIGLNLKISGYRGKIRQLETELKNLRDRETELRRELEKWHLEEKKWRERLGGPEKEGQMPTEGRAGEPGKDA